MESAASFPRRHHNRMVDFRFRFQSQLLRRMKTRVEVQRHGGDGVLRSYASGGAGSLRPSQHLQLGFARGGGAREGPKPVLCQHCTLRTWHRRGGRTIAGRRDGGGRRRGTRTRVSPRPREGRSSPRGISGRRPNGTPRPQADGDRRSPEAGERKRAALPRGGLDAGTVRWWAVLGCRGWTKNPRRRPEVSLRTLPRRTSNRRCSYLVCFRSARKEEGRDPLRRAREYLARCEPPSFGERGGKSEQVLWLETP